MKIHINTFAPGLNVLLTVCILAIIGLIIVVISYSNNIDSITESSIQIYQDKDEQVGGESEVTINRQKDGSIDAKFVLRRGFKYPYAGVSFQSLKNGFWNVSDYTHLRIQFARPPGNLLVILKVKWREYLIPWEFEWNQGITDSIIDIPINRFQVPSWWLSENQAAQTFLNEVRLDKVCLIALQPSRTEKIGQLQAFTLQQMHFCYNIPSWGYWVLGIIILFKMILMILMKKKTHILEIAKIVQFDNAYELKKTIMEYLQSHYNDNELSIAKISIKTGIPEKACSDAINEFCGKPFRMVLNEIRLSEAKRLLIETKMSINKIALLVGYSSASYFNRAFLKAECKPPGEYREIYAKMHEKR